MSRAAAGWCLVLGLLGLGLLPGQEAGKNGQKEQPKLSSRLAFLVGVPSYREKQDLPDLRYVDNDMRDLARVLRRGGFRVARPTSAETRKPEDILAALTALLQEAAPGATLVIALDGHGLHPEGSTDAYFCPANANTSVRVNPKSRHQELVDPKSLLSLKEVLEVVKAHDVAMTLLLVDASRSRPSDAGVPGIDGSRFNADNVAALFSCSPGERSYESQRAGGGHGVFFQVVIDGLEGEAADKDGKLTWNGLVDYVMQQLPDRSVAWVGAEFKQTPYEVRSLRSRLPLLATIQREFENSVGMKLRRIPAGNFDMGSPTSESQRGTDETRHSVRLGRAFYIGKYAVTQAEYLEVMNIGSTLNQSWFPPNGKGAYLILDRQRDTLRYPVENISWYDAVRFCEALTRKEGGRRVYRLPTEAEWEYACRAETRTVFHFGNTLNGEEANCNGYYPYGTTREGLNLERPQPVQDASVENTWKLVGMHGNVWQWCSDWYGTYGTGTQTDPTGPEQGELKVARGGSWREPARRCRAAQRNALVPGYRFPDVGFRVVCTVVEGD